MQHVTILDIYMCVLFCSCAYLFARRMCGDYKYLIRISERLKVVHFFIYKSEISVVVVVVML